MRAAVRCPRLDSRTPTYHHHVAAWACPKENYADPGIESAATAGTPRSAESTDSGLGPDSGSDDAMESAVVRAVGKRRLERQDNSARNYALDCRGSRNSDPVYHRSKLAAGREDKSPRCYCC